jgi:hypothetical protein
MFAAHGGLERWNTLERVSATMVSGGELWAAKEIEVDAVSFVAQQRSRKRRSFGPRRSDVIRGPNESTA